MMPDILILFVLLGAALASVLLVWFNTNAFVEYARLFGCEEFFYVDEYINATVDDPGTSYPEYLCINHPCFFTRLTNCPKCVAIQLSILINFPVLLTIMIFTTPLIWLLMPLSVAVTSYFSLLQYQLLVKLLNK